MKLLYLFTLSTIFLRTAFAPFINDFSGLNRTKISSVVQPTTITELQNIVKKTNGRLSVAGAQYSQGGHTFAADSTVIDMKHFCKILSVDPREKTITAQSGATWAQVQEAIDPYNLSVKVMQSYKDFTVGGSLSVNAHGRYLGYGPIIETVQEITVLLADGSIVTASRKEHLDIFCAVIGGYGGIGIILNVTLDLTDNQKLTCKQSFIPVKEYQSYFFTIVQKDPAAILHNATLYAPHYTHALCSTWYATDAQLTQPRRLTNPRYRASNHFKMSIAKSAPSSTQKMRPLIETYAISNSTVCWRNYEAGYGVIDLFYPRFLYSSLLQEFFVPVDRLHDFLTLLQKLVAQYKVNIINVSLRHVKANNESLLSWSDKESFAIVLFYNQNRFATLYGNSDADTCMHKLIDAALSVGGTYYLPYRKVATQEQFEKAYPRAAEYRAIKKKYDPTGRFSNTFLKDMLLI